MGRRSTLDSVNNSALASGTNISAATLRARLAANLDYVDYAINPAVAYVETWGDDASGVVGSPTRAFATIAAAVTALPSTGGVVKLGIGEFAGAYTIAKDNVKLVGSMMPQPNWTITQSTLTSVTYSDPTKLVDGTIIKGYINRLDGNRIGLFNLGIDVGSDYVANGGTEFNGFGMGRSVSDETANTPAPSYPLGYGLVLKDLVLLCKNSSSSYHALVLENQYEPVIENVTCIHGVHGAALKVSGGYIKNLRTYNTGWDGIIVKSNDYSIAGQLVIDGFRVYNGGSVGGVVIQNKSNTVMKDIIIKNGFINGGTTGVTTEIDFAQGFNNVIIQNVSVRGQSGTAFANSTNYSILECRDNGTRVNTPI